MTVLVSRMITLNSELDTYYCILEQRKAKQKVKLYRKLIALMIGYGSGNIKQWTTYVLVNGSNAA